VNEKRPKPQKTRPRSRIYQRGSICWIYYRLDKRAVRKSLKTTDEPEAKEAQDDTEALLLRNQLRPNEPVPVTDFIKRFSRWAFRERRPETYRKYQWAIDHFLKAAPRADLRDFTRADADAFKAHLLQEKLAPATTNIALRHVKAMLQKAEDWELIEKNPFRRCQMLRVARKVPRFLPREDVERSFLFSWRSIRHMI
jgi:hypothetical protein